MSASLGGASFFMTQAEMIQALVVMFNPAFDPTAWQLYLVGCPTTDFQCVGVPTTLRLTIEFVLTDLPGLYHCVRELPTALAMPAL